VVALVRVPEPLLYKELPVVLVNFHVEWMDRYAGDVETVPPDNQVLSEYGVIGEMENLRPWRGRCYGYLRFPHGFSMTRLGAEDGQDFTDGVTVVWTAPQRGGGPAGTCIVGLYRIVQERAGVSGGPTTSQSASRAADLSGPHHGVSSPS
jgi:hypothetical protein